MPATDGLPSSSRALVPIEPVRPYEHQPITRVPAAFLAHLIATAGQFPQARKRRRAGLAEAIAAYTAALQKSAQ